MNKRLAIIGGLAVFLAPASASAMPWSWDMFTQPSHKAQEEPALARPEGTVPASGKPLQVDRAAAASLANPARVDEKSLERGKLKYDTYCATCHGDTGKGDGLVGQKYIPPTDLTGEYVQGKPDGDLYYTITNGGMAIMPGYGDSVQVEDRWHIINYIRHTIGKKR